MRFVIQRVKGASVDIDCVEYSRIDTGLLVLLGITEGDSELDISYYCDKILNLRLFPDETGKMNLSVKDIQGELMVVSQFTLYGDCKKGRRPNFMAAARPEVAEPIYNKFVSHLTQSYPKVQTGMFGASMQISLTNDGPVTLVLP